LEVSPFAASLAKLGKSFVLIVWLLPQPPVLPVAA
jgi:hypothetical protein